MIVDLLEDPVGGICHEPVIKANILLGLAPNPTSSERLEH